MPYKVSQYNHVEDKYSKDYDLDTWLKQTIEPPEVLRRKVELYRKTLDKSEKAKIPLITVSANFKGIRNLTNVNEHLPFICIDIDRYSKKNPRTGKRKPCNLCMDVQLVKEMFIEHPSTYYCGFSVTSSDGVYAIIKLNELGKIDKYFEMLKDKLSNIGINIDESCKDITRLRFFSYDPEAYYNPDARGLKLPAKKVVKERVNVVANVSDYDKVEKLAAMCEHHGIDITGNYEDWIKIGSVLNNNFGDSGRGIFHRFSKQYSEYDAKKVDKKYDHCKRMMVNNIGLIVNLCKNYGLIG